MSDFSKTIFRTAKRENPYAQIDKTVLNDQRLSWKAKGLMAFLLSKPDNWEINIQNLIRQSTDGKEAVYSGINELINFGYIVRVESRNQGRFARIEYLIYENPQLVNTQNPTDFPTGLPNANARAGARQSNQLQQKHRIRENGSETGYGKTASGKPATTNK